MICVLTFCAVLEPTRRRGFAESNVGHEQVTSSNCTQSGGRGEGGEVGKVGLGSPPRLGPDRVQFRSRMSDLTVIALRWRRRSELGANLWSSASGSVAHRPGMPS